MQHLISRGKPFRDKTPPTHLRNFFQFLFKSGRTNANLAPSVPRIAQRYASRLPRHLTPEQVETVIAAVKADTALGRRNYAMVLLMARLGLRAAEVIAIQIDDIDWRVAGRFGPSGEKVDTGCVPPGRARLAIRPSLTGSCSSRKKDCLRTILAAMFCFSAVEYGERGVPADRWPRGPR